MCSGFGGWKKSFRKSFRKRSASAKASAIFRAHSGNHFSELVASQFPTLFQYLIYFTLAPIFLTAQMLPALGPFSVFSTTWTKVGWARVVLRAYNFGLGLRGLGTLNTKICPAGPCLHHRDQLPLFQGQASRAKNLAV